MIDISNIDFIQRTMILDGEPWRFPDRPYIIPIINDDPIKLLLMTARQSEKSTSTAGKHIASACRTPFQSSLYVSPTMTQTSVYSRKKIDAVLEGRTKSKLSKSWLESIVKTTSPGSTFC